MNFEIIQREEDDFVKFYVGQKEDGSIYAVPCVLDDDGGVDMTATQTKMDAYIEYTDEIRSYT
ncbi:MAG: hypothetical protein CMJ25_18970 [Phycisphaerae bacterium]|nr:hypothetical protein [Phycisphaerae bacterium]|tara:strand:+ start:705 stop:893 length:189 start_codon:yes stop_codon:yes gene_type:complete